MNRRWIACFALAALGSFAGCAPGSDPDPAAAAPLPLRCDVTDVEVARDGMTELGFSADEVLAPFEAEYRSVLQYRDAGTTPLTITVAHDGSPIVLREWTAPIEEPDLECGPKTLIVSVAVTFTTDDGAFAESWTQELHRHDVPPSHTLIANLPTAGLQGTWDPEDATTLSFWVNVNAGSDTPTSNGEIVSVIETTDDSPVECGFAAWNIEPQTGCL